MDVQEPDGTTTYSASRNTFRKCRATCRASPRYPLLNAGCPQQVWASVKSTLNPARSNTSAMAIPTLGNNWSTIQVTKSETRLGIEDSIVAGGELRNRQDRGVARGCAIPAAANECRARQT